MILQQRPQSMIQRHRGVQEWLDSENDGLYFTDPVRLGKAEQHLQDCGRGSYCLKIRNALLLPPHAISWNAKGLTRYVSRRFGFGQALSHSLPKGLSYGRSHLLLTSDDHIVADSFGGGHEVHPSVTWTGDDAWSVKVPSAECHLDERCVYLEMLPGHFGHAIVDMPARLWPLIRSDLAFLEDLRFLTFGTHGVTEKPGTWPEFTTRLLSAYGIDPNRVTVINQPTRVRELIVPRRVAPFRGRSGKPFNLLMARAGRRLATGRPAGPKPYVFLSRSRLSAGNRKMNAALDVAVDAMFERHGFTIIHPQELDLADQVALIRGASHVAGFVGSQLHLAAFSERRGLRMFRICPSFFVTPIDQAILKPLDGDVTDFIVKARLPRGVVEFKARWTLASEDMERLEDSLADWIRNRGQEDST